MIWRCEHKDCSCEQHSEGCSETFCLGGHRCPECNHNFVKEENEICDPCAASLSLCETCKKYTDKFYYFDQDKVPYMQRKVCKNCYEHTCRQCLSFNKELLNTKICLDCKAENEWIMDGNWEGRYPSETYCSNCHEERHLNAEGLCKECYRLLHGNPAFNCVDCGIQFQPGSPHEWLCDSCKPHCEGCGVPFNPETRTENLCSACSFKAKRGSGNCARCNEHSNQLNNLAHCPECSDDLYAVIDSSQDKVKWCRKCNRNKVPSHKSICKSCIEKSYICPICLNTPIGVQDYMCNTCKQENYDLWEKWTRVHKHSTTR